MNGSGKFVVLIIDKWVEVVKNDWNNGFIVGVKVDVKLEVNVKY